MAVRRAFLVVLGEKEQGEKYIISLYMVLCFCFCTFPLRIGKNGFDCEQQHRAEQLRGTAAWNGNDEARK